MLHKIKIAFTNKNKRLLYFKILIYKLKTLFQQKIICIKKNNISITGFSKSSITQDFYTKDIINDHFLTIQDIVFRHYPNSAPIFIDIGANIGIYSISCHHLCKTIKQQIAIEAHPKTFELLVENIAKNHLNKKIKAFNLAISNSQKSKTIDFNINNCGASQLGDNPKNPSITCDTLNVFIEKNKINPNSISWIKIDVEGHEPEVLQEASVILENKIPIVLEFWPPIYKKKQITPTNP